MDSILSDIITTRETDFLIDLVLATFCGFLIGAERERKGKPAGISTQTLVITGAMLFTFLSRSVEAGDATRIAAQVVSGIGFLGAGIILKNESKSVVTNVTTAASIWYSAAIGMALGFNFHFIGVVAAVYAVVISRLPRIDNNE